MQRVLPVIAVNGIIDAQISPLDRGFAYGDGVFETCRLHNSKIPLWDLHKARLLKSCEQLFIPVSFDLIERQLANLLSELNCKDLDKAVVKITVTRGQGGRGYGFHNAMVPTVVIGVFPLAEYPASYFSKGVTVRLCEQRLNCNPALAGLKHLNRLEQILARAEWQDEFIAEGIMFDANDNLIEAVFSNIFLIKDNEIFTPDLSHAGVAGVMRRFILETIAPEAGLTVRVICLKFDDLVNADAIFLCNSLYGIWPVIKITGQTEYTFERHQITEKLQSLVNKSMML